MLRDRSSPASEGFGHDGLHGVLSDVADESLVNRGGLENVDAGLEIEHPLRNEDGVRFAALTENY
jgi:hypothetical protein